MQIDIEIRDAATRIVSAITEAASAFIKKITASKIPKDGGKKNGSNLTQGKLVSMDNAAVSETLMQNFRNAPTYEDMLVALGALLADDYSVAALRSYMDRFGFTRANLSYIHDRRCKGANGRYGGRSCCNNVRMIVKAAKCEHASKHNHMWPICGDHVSLTKSDIANITLGHIYPADMYRRFNTQVDRANRLGIDISRFNMPPGFVWSNLVITHSACDQKLGSSIITDCWRSKGVEYPGALRYYIDNVVRARDIERDGDILILF